MQAVSLIFPWLSTIKKRHQFTVICLIHSSFFAWRSSSFLHCYDLVFFFLQGLQQIQWSFIYKPMKWLSLFCEERNILKKNLLFFFFCFSNDKLSSRSLEYWGLLAVICNWEFLGVEDPLTTHRGYLKMKPN